MPKLIQLLFAFALAALSPLANSQSVGGSGGSAEGTGSKCTSQIKALIKFDSVAEALYKHNSKNFHRFIKCDDIAGSWETAVHEAAHMARQREGLQDSDAPQRLMMITGNFRNLPTNIEDLDDRMLRPREILKHSNWSQFDQHPAGYIAQYLKPGSSSSNSRFSYLLDEFNSYILDSQSKFRLKDKINFGVEMEEVSGMIAFMHFVKAYMELAKTDSKTWAILNQPNLKSLTSDLWGAAEKTLADICKTPQFTLGSDKDRHFKGIFGNAAALIQLLGRKPQKPASCK